MSFLWMLSAINMVFGIIHVATENYGWGVAFLLMGVGLSIINMISIEGEKIRKHIDEKFKEMKEDK